MIKHFGVFHVIKFHTGTTSKIWTESFSIDPITKFSSMEAIDPLLTKLDYSSNKHPLMCLAIRGYFIGWNGSSGIVMWNSETISIEDIQMHLYHESKSWSFNESIVHSVKKEIRNFVLDKILK